MIHQNSAHFHDPVMPGKFRIAACLRFLAGGRFAAQGSMASKHGSASADRMMRFTDDFASSQEAAHLAIEKGAGLGTREDA